MCDQIEWVNDGVCDDATNVEICNFDGGDCCLEYILDAICDKCICYEDGLRHPSFHSHEVETTSVINLMPWTISNYFDNTLEPVILTTTSAFTTIGWTPYTTPDPLEHCEWLEFVGRFLKKLEMNKVHFQIFDYTGDDWCDPTFYANTKECNYDNLDCCGFFNVHHNYCYDDCQCIMPGCEPDDDYYLGKKKLKPKH